MPRRFLLLLLFAVLTLLLAASLLFNIPAAQPLIFSTPPTPAAPYTVTITETGGSHDEVIAALVHSFGSQKDATLDIYQLLTRYGIADVMQAFTLPKAVPASRHPDRFSEKGNMQKADMPDFFVAGTCELDLIKFAPQMQWILDNGDTYLICVVHHADRWAQQNLEEAVKPWVEKGRVEFWTLSPHTAEFLQRESVSKWVTTKNGITSLIRYFVPVFPVVLDSAESVTDEEEDLSFGLQGDYDPSRRDYTSLFNRLETFLSTSSVNVSMHLLGHGDHPNVPKTVKDNVVFDERLNYTTFYSIISRTFALLPAFATDDYLDRKASSSVPAALIAGTPLVATKEMIAAYSYVNSDVVWTQREDMTDLDVVGELLKMQSQERRKKKEAVKRRCAEIIEGNAGRVGVWIREAMERVKKQNETVVA